MIGILKIWFHPFHVDASTELDGCSEGQVGVSGLRYPVMAGVQIGAEGGLAYGVAPTHQVFLSVSGSLSIGVGVFLE